MAKRTTKNSTYTDLSGMTEDEAKRAAAALLGRLGGLKGGNARAKKLSGRRRTEIARKAALTRWEARKKT
jgi:ABC-type phosphate/phosphonate transport system ATPase subunit